MWVHLVKVSEQHLKWRDMHIDHPVDSSLQRILKLQFLCNGHGRLPDFSGVALDVDITQLEKISSYSMSCANE